MTLEEAERAPGCMGAYGSWCYLTGNARSVTPIASIGGFTSQRDPGLSTCVLFPG